MLDYGSDIRINKSPLIKAWTKHYNDLGLSHNKCLKMVYKRVIKGKFP